jgi:hypothetical protein
MKNEFEKKVTYDVSFSVHSSQFHKKQTSNKICSSLKLKHVHRKRKQYKVDLYNRTPGLQRMNFFCYT